MLNETDAFLYLCARGLSDPEWVADGDLIIRSLAKRNRNLGIFGPGEIGYVLKQPDGPESGSCQTLNREALFYEFCQNEPLFEGLSKFLPKKVHSDSDRSLLILEFVPRAMTPGSSQSEPLSVVGSRELGSALASLHRPFRSPGLRDNPRFDWLGDSLPFAFSIHRPWTSLLAHMSPAELRVHQIVQEHERLDQAIEDARSRWRAETVIHGDLKSSNLLIRPVHKSADDPETVELWLIDWELVQIGDPAWDLAGVLQDFLFHWIWSMPSEPELEVGERTARAKYPLETLRPSVRAVWESYRASAQLEPSVADDLLSRSVVFSGIRLIQTALEFSAEHTELSSRTVLLLQISANLLANPLLAQIHLYGIAGDPIPA